MENKGSCVRPWQSSHDCPNTRIMNIRKVARPCRIDILFWATEVKWLHEYWSEHWLAGFPLDFDAFPVLELTIELTDD